MKRRNIIIGVIVGLLVLALIGLGIAWMVHAHGGACARGYSFGPGMMRGWDRGGEAWGSARFAGGAMRAVACLVGLALLGGLVWLIVSLVRSHKAQAPKEPLPQEESALEILKRRYARGEISQEEYQRMKEELT